MSFWAAAVPAVFLAGICWVAARTTRLRETRRGFFLASRRAPAWLIGVGFLSAEISALTVVGVPALSYRENWHYLQFFLGAAAARWVVAALFVPAMLQADATTVYGWLRRRFGPWTQAAGAALFFPTRMAAAGVRLMVAGAAASYLLGWKAGPVIVLTCLAGTALSAAGGMRAVLWAGVLQAAVFCAAGAAAVFFTADGLEGGFAEILHAADSAGRLDLWGPGAMFTALCYGFFGSLAQFGTDQEMMQRLLAAKDPQTASRATLLTIPLSLGALSLFLGLGTVLFVFYEQHPEMALPPDLDAIVAHFAVQNAGPFLRGLLAAAVIAASVDLPALSLSSVFVHDVYALRLRPMAPERELVIAGRVFAVLFGLAVGAAALLFAAGERWLWFGFKAGGMSFGPLLGLFLYGLLTQRKNDRCAAGAAAVVAPVNLFLLILSERGGLAFDWGWLVPLSAAAQMMLTRAAEAVSDGNSRMVQSRR